MKRPGFGVFDPLARLGLRLLVAPLRRWDYKAAQRADYMLANSTHIQADIKRYYGRESTVVHPPVDTERFNVTPAQQRIGFVTAGRLATMKRVDIIVDAATQANVPLTVIGRGPAYADLVKRAGPNVTFLTDVTDEQMPHIIASAQAFLFASHEDFGITPIEAMATGTPVIAYQAGGALDYITPGVTGEFFPEQTVDSLLAALQSFNATKYNSSAITSVSLQFSISEFHKNIRSVIKDCLR